MSIIITGVITVASCQKDFDIVASRNPNVVRFMAASATCFSVLSALTSAQTQRPLWFLHFLYAAPMVCTIACRGWVQRHPW